MLRIIQHITIQVGTYRKTLKCRLPAESRLHDAMECGHVAVDCGFLVKIYGMMQIKISRSAHLCWPTWCRSHRRGNGIISLAQILSCRLNTADVLGKMRMWKCGYATNELMSTAYL